MKKNIFRSVEFWKASIMPLPDHAFFELLRTVFGKIKTPFNKQNLVGDLEKFLTNGDIQKNIASYIDKNDTRIIAAVAVLNEPTAAELDAFFDGELDNTELHDMVINLEERFILYRFMDKDQNTSRLALNPILEPVLEPYTACLSSLFPSFSDITHNKTGKQNLPSFDDRILAALLSFVSQNETFFIREGRIRQRILNMAAAIFPDLQLEPVIGGLQALGLFLANGDMLLPDFIRFDAFGKLDRLERMEYCTAGILCYYDSPMNETSPWLLRAKLRKFTAFIHNFYASLDPDKLYPLVTLRRLVFILLRNNNEINYDMLIKAMEQTGLLISDSNQRWQKPTLPSEGATARKTAAGNGAIGATVATVAMDSPFTLLMYPEIAYNDAVEIASISRVTETGLNVRFEINKDAAVSAFNRGISAAAAIELLQRLSGNRIDENLAFTLLDWEKRHKEVSLCKGLVLSLSPERRYLAETKPLSKYINAILAPGIYMIHENMEEKVYAALKKAGITIFARPIAVSHADDGDTAADSGFFFPRLDTAAAHREKIRQFLPPKKENGIDISASAPSASALIEGFHSIIGKMRLGAEERDELAARINRRLVLCESQLKDAVVRYEKLEARGLDYTGKTMIAKQAIARQSPVEVSWPGRQKQESVIGIPKTLEKTEGESVLVIEPLRDAASIPGDTVRIPGNTVRIPLGKISLLRRIKKSIFENNNNN
ncbi:MAG: hypothetical protein LBB89_02255 [Treponema sp.]|jgi:hypothetical protein|nr:hypothetical protein [Treponema sp.]